MLGTSGLLQVASLVLFRITSMLTIKALRSDVYPVCNLLGWGPWCYFHQEGPCVVDPGPKPGDQVFGHVGSPGLVWFLGGR